MFVNIANKHNISLYLYKARNTHIIVLIKVDSLRLNVHVITSFLFTVVRRLRFGKLHRMH